MGPTPECPRPEIARCAVAHDRKRERAHGAAAVLLALTLAGCGGEASDQDPLESSSGLDPYQLMPADQPVEEAARARVFEFIELMQPLDPSLTSDHHDRQYWQIRAEGERLLTAGADVGHAALHAFTNYPERHHNIKRMLLRIGALNAPEESKGLLEELTMTYGYPIEDRTEACLLFAEIDPERYIELIGPKVVRGGEMLRETLPDDEFLVEGWRIAHEKVGRSPADTMSEIAMDLMMQGYARIIALRSLGENDLTPRSRGALQACLIETLGDGYVRRVAAQTIAASYPREEACTLLQEVRAHEADPAMATFLDDLLMENCR